MRRVMRAVAVLVLLLVLAAIGGYVFLQRVSQPFQGWSGPEVFVEIPAGEGPRAIGRRLIAAGIVRDDLTFRTALYLTGRARELKAGEYRFDRAVSPQEAIAVIASGKVFTRLLTIREGLTIVEAAKAFEEQGFGTAAEFAAAAANPSPIRDLDPEAPDLEGYLFPETYALPRNTPATTLVGLMVGHFKSAFDEPLRAAARAQGLTVRQVVALASLVEKETARGEERPMVAAVYRNRMKLNMGMQADPTVIYALQKAGTYDGNIRREDLNVDSPYNTYRYPGLPPGPIASPGKSSLEAAVRPADVKSLYFVSRNDGSHVFADTLAEHNKNVYQWQVLYFRQKNGR